MEKKRKKEVKINMEGKVRIKITSCTEEEIREINKDIQEIDSAINRRMIEYEIYIKKMIQEALYEEIITITENDSSYFISEYHDIVKDRNIDNIKNRLKNYQLFLACREEVDD